MSLRRSPLMSICLLIRALGERCWYFAAAGSRPSKAAKAGLAMPTRSLPSGSMGSMQDGFRALAVAMTYGLPVRALRRIWTITEGEPVGPWWEMTFKATDRPE